MLCVRYETIHGNIKPQFLSYFTAIPYIILCFSTTRFINLSCKISVFLICVYPVLIMQVFPVVRGGQVWRTVIIYSHERYIRTAHYIMLEFPTVRSWKWLCSFGLYVQSLIRVSCAAFRVHGSRFCPQNSLQTRYKKSGGSDDLFRLS